MQHPSALVPQFWGFISDVILMEGEMTQIFQDNLLFSQKKGKNFKDWCLPVSRDSRHFLILVVFVAWPVWVHFPLNHGTESDSSKKAHLKTIMWCGVYQTSKLNLIGFIAIHLGIADSSTSKNAHVRSRNFCNFANQDDFSARAKYQLNAQGFSTCSQVNESCPLGHNKTNVLDMFSPSIIFVSKNKAFYIILCISMYVHPFWGLMGQLVLKRVHIHMHLCFFLDQTPAARIVAHSEPSVAMGHASMGEARSAQG